MPSFSWLHLTDLHLGMREQDRLWPRIKQKFFDDLRRIHTKTGNWDFVLFTGDLTQSGLQFDGLEKLLDELWEQFRQLGCNPLLLAVPGNHDLVRPASNDPIVMLLHHWCSNEEVRSGFWSSDESPYRKVINNAFSNYDAWWTAQFRRPRNLRSGILPGDFSVTIEKEGAKLGILGLNTSFLQLSEKTKEGDLVLDARQFSSACHTNDGPAWVRQHHACILLTHHPPEWLTEASQEELLREIADPKDFALHLFGHMHQSNYTSISHGGGATRRLWQGRSLFSMEPLKHEQGGRTERLHGYSFGKVEINGDHGVLTFWPRRVTSENKADPWRIIPDYFYTLEDDNHLRPQQFPLLSRHSASEKIKAPRRDGKHDRKRIVDAAIPRVVVVSQPSELDVLIRQVNSQGLKHALAGGQYQAQPDDVHSSAVFPVQFSLDRSGRPLSAQLQVEIEAQEFIPAQQTHAITVPPNGDSDLIKFFLTPKSVGRFKIEIKLRNKQGHVASAVLAVNSMTARPLVETARDWILVQIALETTAVGQTTEAAPPLPKADSDLSSRQAPAAVVDVRVDSTGESTPSLRFDATTISLPSETPIPPTQTRADPQSATLILPGPPNVPETRAPVTTHSSIESSADLGRIQETDSQPGAPPYQSPYLGHSPGSHIRGALANGSFWTAVGLITVLTASAVLTSSHVEIATPVLPTESYQRATIPLPAGFRLAAVSHNHRWLVAENGGKRLALFDLTHLEGNVRTVAWDSTAVLAIDSTGSKVASLDRETVVIRDVPSMKMISLTPNLFRGAVSLVAFSPEDGSLAIATDKGEIALTPIAGNFAERKFSASGPVSAMAFDLKGRRLAVASIQTGTVEIYDITGTGTVLSGALRLSGADPLLPNRLAFDDSGNRLAVGEARGGTVRIWDWRTSNVLGEFRGTGASTRSLSFNDTGRFLALVGDERAVTVWDTETQRMDLWFPKDANEYAVAVFFKNKLYTTAAITDQPRLLVWVHDRIGPVSGATCTVVGTGLTQLSTPDGACLFPQLPTGPHVVHVRAQDRVTDIDFTATSTLALSALLPSPPKPWTQAPARN